MAAICLCAVLVGTTVAIAGAAGVSTGKVGSLELSVGAHLAPSAIPSSRQTPVRLDFTGRVRERPPALPHPPAIRELQIESADLEVHTRGISVCRLGQLEATETEDAEKACPRALIGAGSAVAQVQFAEQGPIDVRSKLLVFNGGTEDGKTMLFLHTYFSNPISNAFVTKVSVENLPGGDFGTFAVAKIPQIIGGTASIIRFHVTVDRKVDGRHPISAICEHHRVRAFVEGRFGDGTKTTAEIVRSCAS